MSGNPDALQKLLQSLQQVPYLASKNLYKVANYFLEQDSSQVAYFCKVLIEASQNVKPCRQCFTWQQVGAPCSFCDSSRRNLQVICVVEKWPDVLAIERTANFTGLYHVLGGAISPLSGIGPEELTINFLQQRVRDKKPSELVLALSQTPEGEATTAYIIDKLQEFKLNISMLAQGMPAGSSLEYTDRVTLAKAITDRKQIL